MAFLIAVPHRALVTSDAISQVGPCQWVVSLPQPAEIAELCVTLLEPLADPNLGGTMKHSKRFSGVAHMAFINFLWS